MPRDIPRSGDRGHKWCLHLRYFRSPLLWDLWVQLLVVGVMGIFGASGIVGAEMKRETTTASRNHPNHHLRLRTPKPPLATISAPPKPPQVWRKRRRGGGEKAVTASRNHLNHHLRLRTPKPPLATISAHRNHPRCDDEREEEEEERRLWSSRIWVERRRRESEVKDFFIFLN